MLKIDDLLRGYGKLVAHHPMLIIAVMLVVTAFCFAGMSGLQMEAMDSSDMLPDTRPEIAALNYVTDEFGSIETGIVVLWIDPEEMASMENASAGSRDIRDRAVILYGDALAQKLRRIDGVSGAKSIADVLRLMNEGRIPGSEKTVRSLLASSMQAPNYVSDDYLMSLVRLELTGEAEEAELLEDINKVIDEMPAPPGIGVGVTGSFAVSSSIQEQVGPDMGKTSMISLLGILVLVYLVFRSLKHSLASLLAILLGNVWSFGFIAALGMSLTSATSGAASMIMGIGIDFGIQIVSRFRQELGRRRSEDAMIKTIEGVTIPMLTTTLAALVGFRAMTLGELSIMGDLGTMMSYGVLGCMIAALTVVPSVLVLIERGGRRRQARKKQMNG